MESTRYSEVPNTFKRFHPFQKANPVSKILFCWLLPVFYKGYKEGLAEEDLFPALKEHGSSELGERIYTLWKNEAETKTEPSLVKILWQIFRIELIYTGIFTLLTEFLLRLTQPIALSKILEYYEPDSGVSKTEALWYSGVIIATATADVICRHYLTLATLHLGMKIRVACCALIYRKALKLNKSVFSETTVGQIVNLISNDVGKFEVVVQYFHFLWVAPIAILIASYLLYMYVGITGTIGVAFLIMFIPLQAYLGKKTSTVRRNVATCTDERLRLMNEIISGIRSIKMYSWEIPFSQLVDNSRRMEIKEIRKKLLIRAIENTLTLSQTRTCIYLCILAYVLLGNSPNSRYIFVLTSFYNILRNTVVMYFNRGISNFAEGKISISRIRTFLMHDEINKNRNEEQQENSDPRVMVSLKNVSTKPSTSGIFFLENINFFAKQKEFVAVIGSVGSGKTTLLNTILKEVTPVSGSVRISGNISYASQEPWLFANSIQENITFGQKYVPTKFEDIVQVCGLKKDLEDLSFGRKSLVGERGVALSGGQKARINLARAVYRDADIYLLDDPLSAVDAEVGKHIFEECLKGYLKDKCVILVTHQHQFINQADKIYLFENGSIKSNGTYMELQNHLGKFSNLSYEQYDKIHETPEKNKIHKNKGNEIHPVNIPVKNRETRMSGHVAWLVYKWYVMCCGHWSSVALALLAFFISQFIGSFIDWFGAFWTNNNQDRKMKQYGEFLDGSNSTDSKQFFFPSYFNNANCILFYSVLMTTFLIVTLCRSVFVFFLCCKGSVVLHSSMFKAIVHTSIHFFEINPIGRILNRFSKDLGGIDEQLPLVVTDALQIGLIAFASFFLIITANRLLLLPTLILLVIFFLLRKIFIAGSRDMKRLQGTTRSPIYSHLTASIEGLSTIRAFGTENILKKEFDCYQNQYSSASFMFLSAVRAFGLWLDINCMVYVSLVTLSALIFENEHFGGNIGLAITQSLGLTSIIQWGIRQWSEVENQMTGVERIKEYADLPPESNDINKEIPINWPANGNINFLNVSLKYSEGCPAALKNVTFCVESGEKIGIVGRTGAGKTSLITALFRLAPIEGQIKVGDIDSTKVPLSVLRSSFSVIPQDPVLFSGSLRRNLDPFERHNDELLWNVLQDIELKAFVSSLPNGLHTKVLEGGSNFSAGQRQLVCLARAIVQSNKIVILDEATASVDPHTDRLIQQTIKRKFSDCTVLTIAHRLQTIIDSDRIMVLDGGSVVEFDHAHKLLQREGGFFHSLLSQGGVTMTENLKKLAKDSYQNQDRISKIE